MKSAGAVQIFALMMLAGLILTPLNALGGDKVIDSSNWQEIEELLPEQALEWVKKGDLSMKLGELEYDPKEYWPSWGLEGMKENVGKHDLNPEMEIVNAKTGERPTFIKGLPFPGVNADDPKAAVKVVYNGYYVRDVQGPLTGEDIPFRFMHRRGFERDVIALFHIYPMDGYGPAAALDNPDDIETLVQVLVSEPYDMAGTGMMTWRYRSKKQDMLYGYVPAIRRVRRMTPANRSDAMFGSDFARDDGGYLGYDGKIPDFEWKLLGKTEVLASFISTKPLATKKNVRDEWQIDVGGQGKELVKFGYETEGWQGAPWMVTSAIWVKRPAWVIEMESKDRYYNYGKTILYVDAEIWGCLWKIIWDRSDEHWKTYHMGWGAVESADKSFLTNVGSFQLIVDERAQHATCVNYTNKDYVWKNMAALEPDQFSLGGFMKICK